MLTTDISGDSVWQDYAKKYYPSGLPDGAKEAILVAKTMQCDEVNAPLRPV
jgi:hypothetical protein